MDKHLKSIVIELTEEQVEQIIRDSVQVYMDPKTFAETMVKVVTIFADIWQTLQEIINDMSDQVNQIKEFIYNHNTTTDIRPERKGWRIPRKIIRDHQIFDKRPRVIYIRSEI